MTNGRQPEASIGLIDAASAQAHQVCPLDSLSEAAFSRSFDFFSSIASAANVSVACDCALAAFTVGDSGRTHQRLRTLMLRTAHRSRFLVVADMVSVLFRNGGYS